jgi:hypothetical protein
MSKKRTKKQKTKILNKRKTAAKIEKVEIVKQVDVSQKETKQKLNQLFAYDLSFIFSDLRKTVLVSFFVTALLVIIYLYLSV